MNFVDMQDEIFHAGEYIVLREILDAANSDDDFKALAAKIGRELRDNYADLRGAIKRAAGWDGTATAWESLQRHIKQNETGGPWWHVLKYADGETVSDEVSNFFKEGK